MAKGSYRAANSWILAADAGPAYKTPHRFGPQIAAFQVHRDSTVTKPEAEGAIHVGVTGINKAEYLAVLNGLRLIAQQMYVGEWVRSPVHVLTDNAFIINQVLDAWEANELGYHLELLNEVVRELHMLTDSPVYFAHAGDGEASGADTLARSFKNACDPRQRAQWELERIRERWLALRQHLRDERQAVLAAGLAGGRASAYDGKRLTISFPAQRTNQKARVEARTEVLLRAVRAVTGVSLKEIRCVEI